MGARARFLIGEHSGPAFRDGDTRQVSTCGEHRDAQYGHKGEVAALGVHNGNASAEQMSTPDTAADRGELASDD